MSTRRDRILFTPNDKISHYTIIKLLGQGGYGDIYAVSDDTNGQIYAMKVEPNNAERQGLNFETNLMRRLQDSNLFPHFQEFGETNTHNFLVMGLYGPSISNTRRQLQQHHYTLSSALRIGLYMVRCIKDFHAHGFIHRDIKPGNFLLNPGSNNPLVLIDYGLSREFIDPSTGMPYPERAHCGFRGTSKYASISAHENKDLSWKDDLISWMYSMIELIDGRLPWLSGRDFERTHRMKLTIPARTLFSSLPGEFIDIWRHLNYLRFNERPNYEQIEDLIIKSMAKNNISPSMPFDWEYLKPTVIREFSPLAVLPKASECGMSIHVPFSLHAASDSPGTSQCGPCSIA